MRHSVLLAQKLNSILFIIWVKVGVIYCKLVQTKVVTSTITISLMVPTACLPLKFEKSAVNLVAELQIHYYQVRAIRPVYLSHECVLLTIMSNSKR